MAVCGIGRATSHLFTLPATNSCEALPLELQVAKPAGAVNGSSCFYRAIVLYILDPEPVLFGAACLHCYAGTGYFQASAESEPESAFRRIFVVGVGHARSDYSADGNGWDSTKLRSLRRRDLPPCDHPMIRSGRGLNDAAVRLASSLAERVFPYVEGTLLGLQAPPERRALLGASYTACLARQV